MISLAFSILAAGLVLATCTTAGLLIYRNSGLPLAVRLTSGMAIYSTLIFILLALGRADLPWMSVISVSSILAALLVRPWKFNRLPPRKHLLAVVIGAYAVLYLTYVAAPEIQPDAVTYHLGLVAEYTRLHSFPGRVGFYEMLPQGVDMLFVPAYAWAGSGGAKAVHFGLFLNLTALVRWVALEAGLTSLQGGAAAAVVFCSPVLGVAGTSAYTDIGALCCLCAALLLLMRWTRQQETAYLVHAAVAAGFCYAVKPTFGWIALLAFGYISFRRSRAALLFACLAFLPMLPWILRAAILTHNPLAPFFNSLFPNPWFHAAMDRRLALEYSAFRPSFHWMRAALDYTVRGGNQGTLGIAFLLLPLGFWSKRLRWMIAVSGLLLVPFLLNTGTRFLLPAAIPALLAAISLLPDRAALAVAIVHAALAFPPVMNWYQDQSDWRLGEIPFRAALGLETKQDYLRRSIDNYDATELVERRVPPGQRVLALASIQQAYTSREVLVFWHSALADDLTAALAGADSNATQRILRAGYRYILIAIRDDPFAKLGRSMLDTPPAWGVVPVGIASSEVLFRISNDDTLR